MISWCIANKRRQQSGHGPSEVMRSYLAELLEFIQGLFKDLLSRKEATKRPSRKEPLTMRYVEIVPRYSTPEKRAGEIHPITAAANPRTFASCMLFVVKHPPGKTIASLLRLFSTSCSRVLCCFFRASSLSLRITLFCKLTHVKEGERVIMDQPACWYSSLSRPLSSLLDTGLILRVARHNLALKSRKERSSTAA